MRLVDNETKANVKQAGWKRGTGLSRSSRAPECKLPGVGMRLSVSPGVNLPHLSVPTSVKQAALPAHHSRCCGKAGTAIILITSVATAVMGNAALCASEVFSPLSGISLGQQQETGREVLLSLCEAKPSRVIVVGTVGIGLQMQSRNPC